VAPQPVTSTTVAAVSAAPNLSFLNIVVPSFRGYEVEIGSRY
jgi:hypothetical protein